jgi:hypothetical protein
MKRNPQFLFKPSRLTKQAIRKSKWVADLKKKKSRARPLGLVYSFIFPSIRMECAKDLLAAQAKPLYDGPVL